MFFSIRFVAGCFSFAVFYDMLKEKKEVDRMEKKVEVVYRYEILRQAERFKRAVEIMQESHENMVAIPAEKNACFACELYLKYLVAFDNCESTDAISLQKCGHSLDELFKKLPEGCKNNIISEMNISEEDFLENIEKVGKNYIALRYEYENEKITYSFGFINHLMCVLDKHSHELESN